MTTRAVWCRPSATSWRSGSTPRSPPASPGTGWSSTPGSASPSTASTTGSCSPTWPRSRNSATRCSWAPAASRSSAPCWPTRRGTPGRWTVARPPPPPSAWSWRGGGGGGSGSTTYAPHATPCGCWKHSEPLGRRGDTVDELALTGLECWGHHGVFEHERRDGQLFVVDLVLGLDTAAAAASDDLSATVDY